MLQGNLPRQVKFDQVLIKQRNIPYHLMKQIFDLNLAHKIQFITT